MSIRGNSAPVHLRIWENYKLLYLYLFTQGIQCFKRIKIFVNLEIGAELTTGDCYNIVCFGVWMPKVIWLHTKPRTTTTFRSNFNWNPKCRTKIVGTRTSCMTYETTNLNYFEKCFIQYSLKSFLSSRS